MPPWSFAIMYINSTFLWLQLQTSISWNPLFILRYFPLSDTSVCLSVCIHLFPFLLYTKFFWQEVSILFMFMLHLTLYYSGPKLGIPQAYDNANTVWNMPVYDLLLYWKPVLQIQSELTANSPHSSPVSFADAFHVIICSFASDFKSHFYRTDPLAFFHVENQNIF